MEGRENCIAAWMALGTFILPGFFDFDFGEALGDTDRMAYFEAKEQRTILAYWEGITMGY